MKLTPLFERELRVGARRTGLFWLRGVLALAIGFQGYELLTQYSLAPPAGTFPAVPSGANINGSDLLHSMAAVIFLATLLMGLLSADSISRERREGTLGLLLLTDLTPEEIVRGKLFSCGLTCFLVLLGAVPALMMPVLAGGVSGAEAAMTGLALLNTLFVALAAGLWMSAVFRERRYAMGATLALLTAATIGPEILGSVFPITMTHTLAGLVPTSAFRLIGLAGWTVAAKASFFLHPIFLLWFALMQGLGWIFLRQAAAVLAANWQDKPEKHFREPEALPLWETPVVQKIASRAEIQTISQPRLAPRFPSQPPPLPQVLPPTVPSPIPPRSSWLTNPRPWDADPIRWRFQRMGSSDGLLWLAIGLNFLAQFGALGQLFNATSGAGWGALSVSGLMVIIACNAFVAWAGARFFLQTQRDQDLELLLTTPMGSENILGGQWALLWRGFAWPAGIILALALPLGIALLYDSANGYGEEFWFHLHPFLVAVNLVLETITLCWVGMWFGLHSRNPVSAATRTVMFVQAVPLGIALAWMWGWNWLGLGRAESLFGEKIPAVIPALLFFVTKNVGLILWARYRLRHDLRLGHRRSKFDGSTTRLILQPA